MASLRDQAIAFNIHRGLYLHGSSLPDAARNAGTSFAEAQRIVRSRGWKAAAFETTPDTPTDLMEEFA